MIISLGIFVLALLLYVIHTTRTELFTTSSTLSSTFDERSAQCTVAQSVASPPPLERTRTDVRKRENPPCIVFHIVYKVVHIQNSKLPTERDSCWKSSGGGAGQGGQAVRTARGYLVPLSCYLSLHNSSRFCYIRLYDLALC